MARETDTTLFLVPAARRRALSLGALHRTGRRRARRREHCGDQLPPVQHIRNSHPRVADPQGACARCGAPSVTRKDDHQVLEIRYLNMVPRLR